MKKQRQRQKQRHRHPVYTRTISKTESWCSVTRSILGSEKKRARERERARERAREKQGNERSGCQK